MNGKSLVVQDQLGVAWMAAKDEVTTTTWRNLLAEGRHDPTDATWPLPVQFAPVCFYKRKEIVEQKLLITKKYLMCWLPFNILKVVTCAASFADLRLLRVGFDFSWWAKSTLMILFDRIAPSIFTCALAASCPMNEVKQYVPRRKEPADGPCMDKG
jgi:hypothetical protein